MKPQIFSYLLIDVGSPRVMVVLGYGVPTLWRLAINLILWQVRCRKHVYSYYYYYEVPVYGIFRAMARRWEWNPLHKPGTACIIKE